MALTDKDIQKIASLSRIALQEGDVSEALTQLNGILGWIDQLTAVNTKDVLPYRDLCETSTHEREDIVTASHLEDSILKNAPSKAHNMFAVPKVVE